MIDATVVDEVSGDARARSNVVRLAAAQALTGANSAVIFATGSIVGATLAPSISFATVPLSIYVVGLAAGTLPTGVISRRYGRRVAFMIGTGCGVLTGLLGAFAILHSSFPPFRCGRWCERRVSSEGGVVGHGRRRVRRRARPPTRAVDDGYLAALFVRVQLCSAGDGRAGGDGGAGGGRRAEAGAIRSSRRPPIAGDRAAAAVHCRGPLRHRLLSDDEPGDESGAAGGQNLRAQRQRFEFRHSVAYRCDVRAELFYRHPDRAVRRAADRCHRTVARGRRRGS